MVTRTTARRGPFLHGSPGLLQGCPDDQAPSTGGGRLVPGRTGSGSRLPDPLRSRLRPGQPSLGGRRDRASGALESAGGCPASATAGQAGCGGGSDRPAAEAIEPFRALDREGPDFGPTPHGPADLGMSEDERGGRDVLYFVRLVLADRPTRRPRSPTAWRRNSKNSWPSGRSGLPSRRRGVVETLVGGSEGHPPTAEPLRPAC
jgi:hypothetical protein